MHNKTLIWAGERGILTNGLATTQALKLGSEIGELCTNLLTGKPIEDDVGDCLVVMTNLADLQNLNLLECIAPAVSEEDLIMNLIGQLGLLQDKVIKGQSVGAQLGQIVSILELISYNTPLVECWELAYNEIKDRQGVLNKQGNFIKSTDSAYPLAQLEHLADMPMTEIETLLKDGDSIDVHKPELTIDDILGLLKDGYTAIPF